LGHRVKAGKIQLIKSLEKNNGVSQAHNNCSPSSVHRVAKIYMVSAQKRTHCCKRLAHIYKTVFHVKCSTVLHSDTLSPNVLGKTNRVDPKPLYIVSGKNKPTVFWPWLWPDFWQESFWHSRWL